MIAKPYRFHGYNSLRFVYRNGQTMRTKALSLKYCPNPRRQHSRLAVVVAKKVAKQAPVRNRIRRRLYEVMRQQWPMLKPGYDLVLTVFDEHLATNPAAQLNRQVVELLTRAELQKDQ